MKYIAKNGESLIGWDKNISGYYLIAHGWERSKSNYKKGNDLITYNGTEWFLNGTQIDDDIKNVP